MNNSRPSFTDRLATIWERLAMGILITIVVALVAMFLWVFVLLITGNFTQETGNSTAVIGSNGLEYNTTTVPVSTNTGDITCILIKGHGVNEMACVR